MPHLTFAVPLILLTAHKQCNILYKKLITIMQCVIFNNSNKMEEKHETLIKTVTQTLPLLG